MEKFSKKLLENRKKELIKELRNPLYWLIFRKQIKSEIELINMLLNKKIRKNTDTL
jgi:hypothetical protein